MYVVIAGAGQVGTQVARVLLDEGHSVAVVESDRKRFEALESMDVLAVEGNAASPGKLREAGINSADLLVAVTGSDEANIIASVIGKSKGCRTVARLNSADYMKEDASTGRLDLFGIDLAVSPDVVTATQISRMLMLPSLMEARDMARGSALAVELRLAGNCSAVGRMPASIKLPAGASMVAVARGDLVLKPELAGALKEDDRLILVLTSSTLTPEVERAFGTGPDSARQVGETLERGMHKVVIVGATRTGILAARMLEGGKAVVLVDGDHGRCVQATGMVSGTMVINGDATDPDLFHDEGLGDAGVLAAVTPNPEYNMLCCLLAKKRGVPRTMAVVDNPEMRQLFEQAGVDVALSPRMLTVNTIIRNITGRKGKGMLSTMQGSGARVMEVPVTDDLWLAGREYGQLRMPPNSLLAAAVRDGKVMVPTRFDIVRPGDRIILIVGQGALRQVERMFSRRSRGWRHR